MTEIPEHLRKRAEVARERAADPGDPEPVPPAGDGLEDHRGTEWKTGDPMLIFKITRKQTIPDEEFVVVLTAQDEAEARRLAAANHGSTYADPTASDIVCIGTAFDDTYRTFVIA